MSKNNSCAEACCSSFENTAHVHVVLARYIFLSACYVRLCTRGSSGSVLYSTHVPNVMRCKQGLADTGRRASMLPARFAGESSAVGLAQQSGSGSKTHCWQNRFHAVDLIVWGRNLSGG